MQRDSDTVLKRLSHFVPAGGRAALMWRPVLGLAVSAILLLSLSTCAWNAARASAPVRAALTACVMDGALITVDGFLIHAFGEQHRPLDVSPYNGQKIELEGSIRPGDHFDATSLPKVLGSCEPELKLKLLPSLARYYRWQVEAEEARKAALQPPPSVALLGGKPAPVIDCASPPGPGNACYEIVRVPKNGGPPTVLRRSQLIGHVLVDEKFVYWTEGEIGAWKMMRWSKSTGAIDSVAAGSLRGSLARTPDGFLVDIFDEGLFALPDGKEARALVPGKYRVSELAVAGDDLYWTEYGPSNSTAILTMPRAGGASHVLACGQPVASLLTVAGQDLVWANLNVPPIGTAQIVALPREGGVPRVLVDVPGHPLALAADATSLYWVQDGPDGYRLFRASIGGGAPARVGTAPARPMHRDNRDRVALDQTHVYWNARESVARVAKGGGPVEEVVRMARGDVMSFAIDDSDVYVAAVIF
jgi:hypothetical protein